METLWILNSKITHFFIAKQKILYSVSSNRTTQIVGEIKNNSFVVAKNSHFSQNSIIEAQEWFIENIKFEQSSIAHFSQKENIIFYKKIALGVVTSKLLLLFEQPLKLYDSNTLTQMIKETSIKLNRPLRAVLPTEE